MLLLKLKLIRIQRAVKSTPVRTIIKQAPKMIGRLCRLPNMGYEVKAYCSGVNDGMSAGCTAKPVVSYCGQRAVEGRITRFGAISC